MGRKTNHKRSKGQIILIIDLWEISLVTWLQNHGKEESEICHNVGDSYLNQF